MNWSIDLTSLTRGTHRIETVEGAVRHGRVTRVDWRTKKIDGREIREPVAIELNSDSDVIDWAFIITIDRLTE